MLSKLKGAYRAACLFLFFTFVCGLAVVGALSALGRVLDPHQLVLLPIFSCAFGVLATWLLERDRAAGQGRAGLAR